ncbi:hypothetical protein AbraIFM66950_011232, partial [Aspergillus brasiliensis]
MSPQPKLLAEQRWSAIIIFRGLIELYGLEQSAQKGYYPAALVLGLFDCAIYTDVFLMLFFSFLHRTLCGEPTELYNYNIMPDWCYFDNLASWSQDRIENVKSSIEDFAEYIIQDLLLPLRILSLDILQSTSPSQPSAQTPTTESSTQQTPTMEERCLLRDYHECVVSSKFDDAEAQRRFIEDGVDFKDNDGNLPRNEPWDRFEFLEAAYILPPSLATLTADNTELSNSQKATLRFLIILDPRMTNFIEDQQLDTTANAITMTPHYHQLFSAFKIYFESTGNPNEYEIRSTTGLSFPHDPVLPVVRTLTMDPECPIDLPSPLLAVHYAIACIIEVSGAGPYVEG